LNSTRRKHFLGVALFGAAGISGCTHLGPKTVSVDRFDYRTAIAKSWKQQTPFDIVKLRYPAIPSNGRRLLSRHKKAAKPRIPP
jgi:hypothetical protein